MTTAELKYWGDHPEIETSVAFEYPNESLGELIQDYFIRKYWGEISLSDAAWLADLIADFLVDEINLVKRSRLYREYRILARRMIGILVAIDEEIERSPDPGRKWKEISLALGLPSACLNSLTEVEIAAQYTSKRRDTLGKPLSKMAVSKSVNRLAAACGLEPAFGFGAGHRTFRNLEH